MTTWKSGRWRAAAVPANWLTVPRLALLAIGLTLLAIIFIEANADPGGRIFWHLLFSHDLPAAWLMLTLLAFGYRFGMWPFGAGLWVERSLLALDCQREPCLQRSMSGHSTRGLVDWYRSAVGFGD